MKLTIELLAREAPNAYVALCKFPDEPLSRAGIGEGSTQRQAAQQSINSYYSRREADANPLFSITFSEPLTEFAIASDKLGARSILDGRRETERAGVLAFLRSAIAADPTPQLSLEYEDADGVVTTRDIYPSSIEERPDPHFMVPVYLKAVDCAKDEPRTFRLDRIRAVEYANA
jgi:predicted DNA-binding transcriptional regulator YafY